MLIIKDKKNLIRYCNASSFVVVFRNGKTEKYVNILSIISTLSPSASHRRCRCWRLVVVVDISSSLLFHRCQQRSTLSWLHPSASAPRRRRCCRCRCHWVSFCRWRLVVVVVVEFLSLVSSSLGVLSLTASCCCYCCRLVVVIVVDVGGVLSLSLLLSAASRRSLKFLVYIRLAMHETTMDPQHIEKNGTALL